MIMNAEMSASSDEARRKNKSTNGDIAFEPHPPARFNRNARVRICHADKSVRRFMASRVDPSELAAWTETDIEVQLWDDRFRIMSRVENID